ncbi:MAG: tetratricopeptide repeat protein [Rubrivivax sp.]|nr:tetratricopeptide repeat protein [Rubrivivax sp.]
MSRTDYLWLKFRAMGLLVLGRPGPALSLFEEMRQRWPDDPYVLASLANQYHEAGRPADAVVASARLVEVQPDRAAHWFNHGFLLEANERWLDALEAFRRATGIDPKLDRAWYGQGLVLIRLHRFDEAVAALKRNTELQPMSPYGWYQLARVHVDRQQPDEAVKIIRHLKGFEPKVAAQLERETGLLAGQPSS